jgi:hypothetical protein
MLIFIDKLSPEERVAAAKASRKARPTVKLRAEFAKGALCWRVKTHKPLIYERASRLGASSPGAVRPSSTPSAPSSNGRTKAPSR